MKPLTLLALVLFLASCSTKEVKEDRHMISDELYQIQKAKDAVKLADSVSSKIGQDPSLDSTE